MEGESEVCEAERQLLFVQSTLYSCSARLHKGTRYNWKPNIYPHLITAPIAVVVGAGWSGTYAGTRMGGSHKTYSTGTAFIQLK